MEARWRRLDSTRTGLAIAAALLAALLLTWGADRFGEPPRFLRLSISLAGWITAALLYLRWFRRWHLHPPSLQDLAIRVQQTHPSLGDTLLGIVEITLPGRLPDHFSPAIAQAAIQQVAQRAAPIAFDQSLDLNPLRKTRKLATQLAIATATLALLFPALAPKTFLRWLNPAGSTPRPTLIELSDWTPQATVPHGEPFELSGTVRSHTFWTPSTIQIGDTAGGFVTAPITNNHATVHLASRTHDTTLTLRSGDARASVRINPILRPALKSLTATLQYPAYLDYPNTNTPVPAGVLTVVEGARAKIQGETTRDLHHASATPGNDPATRSDHAGTITPWTVNGPSFQSGWLLNPDPTPSPNSIPVPPMGVGSQTLQLSWTDRLGLSNSPAWRLNLQTVADLPPVPDLPDTSRELAVLASEPLNLKAVAQDDFGVRELGIKWETEAPNPATNAAPGEKTAPETPDPDPALLPASSQIFRQHARTPNATHLEEAFTFSPSLLHIPPDSTVLVRAWATDALPGRTPVESAPVVLHVVGNERHAELIRQQLEGLLARLEEVTRQQEQLHQDTEALRNADPQKLSPEEANRKLAELADQQERNTELLKELAREGTQTLREAARNTSIRNTTLREWAHNIQAMKNLAQNQMKEAAQSTQKARQNKDAKERKEALDNAAEKSQDAKESLEQLQKDAARGLDDLQALTLAQRLRRIGESQKDVETRLRKVVPETIGLLPSELTPRQLRLHENLSREQAHASEESKQLQGEISRFFERTHRFNYGQVSKDMEAAKPLENLDQIRALILDNIAMQAMQNLGTWAARFDQWAEALEPPQKSSDSQSGSQSGGDNAEQLLEELIALLRLRESQTNLREQTRLVDSERPKTQTPPPATAPSTPAQDPWSDAARDLAARQRRLMVQLNEVRTENPVAPLKPVLNQAFDAMRQTESVLNRPDTGDPARTGHTLSVEALSDAINLLNEQTEKSSSSSSASSSTPSPEEMAFLMEMMAKQGQGMTAQSPGGNMAGGSTDRSSPAASGNATGRPGSARSVSKATGFGTSVPTEFRDALDRFFQAVENNPATAPNPAPRKP